jgi:hypothetical protein
MIEKMHTIEEIPTKWMYFPVKDKTKIIPKNIYFDSITKKYDNLRANPRVMKTIEK